MIDAIIDGNIIKVTFAGFVPKDKFTEAVYLLRRIKGRKFVNDNGSKRWEYPIESKQALINAFGEDISFTSEIVTFNHEEEIEYIEDNSFIEEMKLKPFDFQLKGINFLVMKECCLLGDSMGLGKTVQILGACFKLFKEKKATNFLIITPSSLKHQWSHEIEKFLPPILNVVISGNVPKRKKLYTQIKEEKTNFVIINYELLFRNPDFEELQNINWDVIALDECHKIKNEESLISKTVKKFNAKYKWAITGTPVQNRPEELFNIFQWINPKILGRKTDFKKRHYVFEKAFYGRMIVVRYRNLRDIHKKISPYMIRRLTKEVAPELPDLIISNRYIEMTTDQLKAHKNGMAELESRLESLGKVNLSKSFEENENSLIKILEDRATGIWPILQVIADAPILLKESDSPLAKRYFQKFKNLSSPKIEIMKEIIIDYLDEDENNKIVIFSRFQKIQKLIQKELSNICKSVIVSGVISAEEKDRNIKAFKADKEIKVLIASDAMNYGVNLQEASLIIQLDLPFNPAVYKQRNGRIHRIDSKHESLQVINLICLDSVDEITYNILMKKESMAKEIIESEEENESLEEDNKTIETIIGAIETNGKDN